MAFQELESANQVTDKLSGWWETFVDNLPNLGVALAVLIVSFLISKLVYRAVLKLIYKRINQTSVTQLIARTASTVVVLGGLILALVSLNLGKALTAMLSAAGVSGLVIGLALQGTLSNLISGIALSFRKNISIGDWIESNGYAGEVTDINLNYFVMREADNNIVVLPNSKIMENPFKNFSKTTEMRITLNCGVGYESDLERVQAITKKTIAAHFDQEKLERELEFYYTEFGDSSINFISRFWIKGANGLDKLRAKSKAIIELKKAFDKEGINIPFPIRTLQFDNALPLSQKPEKAFSEN